MALCYDWLFYQIIKNQNRKLLKEQRGSGRKITGSYKKKECILCTILKIDDGSCVENMHQLNRGCEKKIGQIFYDQARSHEKMGHTNIK